MSQPEHRTVNVADHEKANRQGMVPFRSRLILLDPVLPRTCPLDAAPNCAQMAQNHEQQAMFNDSSMPLFTMYCKITKDDKRAENLIKRFDNVVVFVRASFYFILF
jgi:hypothetical protein